MDTAKPPFDPEVVGPVTLGSATVRTSRQASMCRPSSGRLVRSWRRRRRRRPTRPGLACRVGQAVVPAAEPAVGGGAAVRCSHASRRAAQHRRADQAGRAARRAGCPVDVCTGLEHPEAAHRATDSWGRGRRVMAAATASASLSCQTGFAASVTSLARRARTVDQESPSQPAALPRIDHSLASP